MVCRCARQVPLDGTVPAWIKLPVRDVLALKRPPRGGNNKKAPRSLSMRPTIGTLLAGQPSILKNPAEKGIHEDGYGRWMGLSGFPSRALVSRGVNIDSYVPMTRAMPSSICQRGAIGWMFLSTQLTIRCGVYLRKCLCQYVKSLVDQLRYRLQLHRRGGFIPAFMLPASVPARNRDGGSVQCAARRTGHPGTATTMPMAGTVFPPASAPFPGSRTTPGRYRAAPRPSARRQGRSG